MPYTYIIDHYRLISIVKTSKNNKMVSYKPVILKHSTCLITQGLIHGGQTHHGPGKEQFIHKINE